MIDLTRKADLDRALELMYFGFRKLVEGPDSLLARRRMNRAHHRTLYFVARRPGLTMTELLASLAVTKQAVNRPLRDLERRGLIRISQDSVDRRVRRLETTAAGALLEARLSGLQRTRLARVFRTAGAGAEDGWRRVMGLMGERPDLGMASALSRAAVRPRASLRPLRRAHSSATSATRSS